MIKPILRTLSFSIATFASAAILSASDQVSAADRGPASPESTRAGCAAPADVELGWEEQLARLDKLLAEKEAEGLAVPGAIITPPFETFAPYRTDVPPAVSTNRAVRISHRNPSDRTSRD